MKKILFLLLTLSLFACDSKSDSTESKNKTEEMVSVKSAEKVEKKEVAPVKSVEYYYEHPAEARAVIQQCWDDMEARMDKLDEQSKHSFDETMNNETLLDENIAKISLEINRFKEWQHCANAMTAGEGIQVGDLNKAIFAGAEDAWSNSLVKLEEGFKELIETQKAAIRKKAKEQAQAEKIEKIKSDTKAQYESMAWDEYVILFDNHGCKTSSVDPELRAKCEVMQRLDRNKQSEGQKQLLALPYVDYLAAESDYCESKQDNSAVCRIWRSQEIKARNQAIDAYKADESKLKADYNKCYNEVNQYEEFSGDSNARRLAKEAFPCPIVSMAAYQLYGSTGYAHYIKLID